MKRNNTCKRFFARFMAAVLVLVTALAVYQPVQAEAAGETLLNTYGKTYGYSGTCINLSQLRDSNTLNQIKQQYNSITLENEMKPDALLGYSANTMSVSQAKNQGYYIPSNYKESTVPVINFSTIDEVMKICYQNGLGMRAHTLVWHSQTPSWFFRSNYSGSGSYVSTSVMDARLEMYVKTVINHVYNNQYGSVVYAWDVVNEIQHASNSGWEAVYGNNRTQATYVKKAFEYAYSALSAFGLNGKVKLFSNDYNTYMCVKDEIALINYVNSNGKICDGIGMQSHLGTNYPSVDYYLEALNSFLKAGFEVQITEMDITNNGDSDMANYAKKLYDGINSAKKNGGKITSITWWGVSDQVTWINNAKPLLFSSLSTPKQAYYSVIESYTNTFGSGNSSSNSGSGSSSNTGNTGNTNTGNQGSTNTGTVNTSSTIQLENMTLSGQYAGTIGSPFNGVALYANNDKVFWTQQFGYNTHDFTLRGCSNNSVAASVDLYIGGEKKGTFTFNNSTPTDVTLKNITHATGNVKIELVVSTDVGTWDAYLDSFVISAAGTSSNSNNTNTGNNENANTGNTQTGNTGNAGNTETGNTGNTNTGNTGNNQETTTPEQPSSDGVKAEYSINNWGSGYQVSFKIVNKSGAKINSWTLVVPKSQIKINASWNINVKESGDNYVITPVSWNSAIDNNGSVEFGILGSGSIGNTISCTVK